MKRSLVIVTLAMLGFGGYIGYMTNYTNTAKATIVDSPIQLNLPRSTGFDLNIDLNRNTIAAASTTSDISINIEQKDSIVYMTKFVDRFIPTFVKVRETRPVHAKRTKLIDFVKTESPEKINLDRNLKLGMRYKNAISLNRYTSDKFTLLEPD